MDVLKSKSFWSSVATVAALFIVAAFPQFAGSRDELIAAISTIGVSLVVGHKGKDVLLALVTALITRTSIQDELATEEAPQV